MCEVKTPGESIRRILEIPDVLRICAVLVLLAGLGALPGMATQPPSGGGWSLPTCRNVSGSGAITFTTDDGLHLTATSRRLEGVGYTMGVVALEAADTLLAVYNRTLLRSTNAGCKWTSLGTLTSTSDSFPLFLTKAPKGRVYAWADQRPDLVRIDGTTVSYLISPVPSLAGLGTDPRDRNHVRLADGSGAQWDSTDAGRSWAPTGRAPSSALTTVYRAAFDPTDLNHVLVGTAVNGAFVSMDGGSSWSPCEGLSSTGGSVNVFNLVVSPADPQYVYAMGIDLAEAGSGALSAGRHIYFSTDGGLSFRPVVDDSPDVILANGPLMAPHPTRRDVLYFVFGTGFRNYGTDLYRYDGRTGGVTKTHNAYDSVRAIAFSPADPSLLYLGLASEDFSAP